MPRKAKKTHGPPHRVWVVVDAATGNPVLTMRTPPDPKFDLMDNEAIYEYTIKEK